MLSPSEPAATIAKTATCERCGKPFEYRPLMVCQMVMDVEPRFCDPCDAIETAERQRAAADAESLKKFEAAEARRTGWNAICPPRFIATDLNHAAMRTKCAREALAWQGGPAGLMMYGETDSGKSRILWELCRRASVNDGKTVEVFGATDFAFRLTKSFAEGNAHYCAFVELLRRVDILALDDLGKERMTERVQSELFGIVDYRMNFERPIIVTTNHVGETLASRFMDEQMAAPLIRRLRDSCQCIAMYAHRRP